MSFQLDAVAQGQEKIAKNQYSIGHRVQFGHRFRFPFLAPYMHDYIVLPPFFFTCRRLVQKGTEGVYSELLNIHHS
jgi:hypothetical protein